MIKFDDEISIRPSINSDAEIFYLHQTDIESCQMTKYHPRDREEFYSYWNNLMENSKARIATILVGSDIGGYISIWPEESTILLDYWLGKEFWNKGITSRALSLFLKEYQVRPIEAHVAQDNIASSRVLEKNGFKRCGENIDVCPRSGMIVHEYIYKVEE